MMPIPRWAIEYIDKRECPHCEEPTKLGSVFGIGVRERKSASGYVLTMEYSCPYCNKKSIFIAETESGIITAVEIYESIIKCLNEKTPLKIKNKGKSKITDKEVSELIEDLNNAKTIEDVLRSIGLTDEEIRETDNE